MDYRAGGRGGVSGHGLGLGDGPVVVGRAVAGESGQHAAGCSSQITGVIPFEQTIFLWQSLALTAVLDASSRS